MGKWHYKLPPTQSLGDIFTNRYHCYLLAWPKLLAIIAGSTDVPGSLGLRAQRLGTIWELPGIFQHWSCTPQVCCTHTHPLKFLGRRPKQRTNLEARRKTRTQYVLLFLPRGVYKTQTHKVDQEQWKQKKAFYKASWLPGNTKTLNLDLQILCKCNFTSRERSQANQNT